MEFELKSLRESIKDKLQHGPYSLYCVLLATRADVDIFPGLLPHFQELHEVTGSHVLLLAPAIRIGHKDKPSLTDYWRWFRDGVLPECTLDPASVRARLDVFFERQTSETYSLVRDLGIRADEIPCLLFFESMRLRGNHIDADAAHFLWPLKSLSPEMIISSFRTIVPLVQQKAQLDLRVQHTQLMNQASREFDLSRQISKLEVEVRNLEMARDPERFAKAKETAARELLSAYDAIKDDEAVRFPRPHIGQTITKLSDASDDETDIADHLEKHLSRWHKRFPQRYHDAIVSYLSARRSANRSASEIQQSLRVYPIRGTGARRMGACAPSDTPAT
jgi:hypothetical protein